MVVLLGGAAGLYLTAGHMMNGIGHVMRASFTVPREPAVSSIVAPSAALR